MWVQAQKDETDEMNDTTTMELSTCAAGHALVEHLHQNPLETANCDVCGRGPLGKTYRCSPCNFDMCFECYSPEKAAPDEENEATPEDADGAASNKLSSASSRGVCIPPPPDAASMNPWRSSKELGLEYLVGKWRDTQGDEYLIQCWSGWSGQAKVVKTTRPTHQGKVFPLRWNAKASRVVWGKKEEMFWPMKDAGSSGALHPHEKKPPVKWYRSNNPSVANFTWHPIESSSSGSRDGGLLPKYRRTEHSNSSGATGREGHPLRPHQVGHLAKSQSRQWWN